MVRRHWKAVTIWTVFHLVLTSLPESSLPHFRTGLRLDWVVHLGLGTVLGSLLARQFGDRGGPWWLWAWLGIAVFGALDEWHQPTFGRSAEWMDWIMDITGGALGLALGMRVLRSRWGQWLR